MNPVVATPPADQIVARDNGQQTSTAGELSDPTAETSAPTEAPRKHDWL